MKRITSFLVCLAFFGITAFGQDVQVSGKVTGADGSALPGVSVVVKGTTVGTTSDIDGNYAISAPSDATLVFSFIGMTTEEVAIGGQTVINISMEADATDLEEVVVTAFGISREKKAVAYQTEEVDSEKLLAGQTTTAAQGLVGKVAGLQVNVQDNGVNPQSQIILRGMRSVSGNNEALIVIDGAIATTGAFNDLNANDIESINVLKGATAAALYGSNASNGALIVTTKQGKANQRFTVGFRNATTFETVQYMPDFQTEHGIGWDGIYNPIENTNWGPRFDGQLRQVGPTYPGDGVFFDGSKYQSVAYSPIADNLKDMYNTGTTVQNTVYITGGDNTGNFYMSVGNQNTFGIIPDDHYERITVKANASKRIGKIKLGVNTSFMTDKQSVVGNQIGDQDRTFYWFVLNTPANMPLTSYSDWSNPDSWGYADNYFNAFYQNPYWAIGTNRNNDNSNRFIGNANFKYDILENLAFTARGGVNRATGRGKNWRAYQEYDPSLQPYHSTVSSFVEDTEYQSVGYTGDFLLNGDFKLTSDFSLKAILGSAIIANQFQSTFIRANNLSIPDFYDISNGTGEKIATADAVENRTFGVFGDLTLDYKKWAYLMVTGRQDWTSTLPEGKNSYFYPSFGASVILSEAIPALQGNQTLTFLKVTANNSTVFKDPNPYVVNERFFQSGGFPFGAINGFFQGTTAVDEDLKKERVNSTEFGVNMAFLRRFTLDASYFMTKTTDLFTYTTPSDASGANAYFTNIGELSGTGFEVTIGATVLEMGDFKWDINANYYTNESKVVSINEEAGLTEIALDAYGAGYGTYAIVGEAFPQIKAVSYVRDEQDRVVVDEASGDPLVGELKALGQTLPKYTISGNSTVSWKGLSAFISMDFRAGHIYYAQGQDAMEFTGRSMESISAGRKDFVWPNSVINTGTADAPVYVENTSIPITGGEMAFWKDHYNQIKENYVKKADAFKIREIAVTYDLPSSILQNTQVIQKLTVGFVARNVFTGLPKGQSKFSDPEFRNTRGTDDPNGVGIGGYLSGPPTRSYGFSVNVEF